MKVKKVNLLLIASIVWMFAGLNILKIGIEAYGPYLKLLNFILSAMIFLIFQIMVFSKLVIKHTNRIENYQETMQPFYNFFDIPSFIIMAFMMTFGILLRSLSFIPREFIAVFYVGIGTSLLVAGISFGINFIKFLKRSN